MTKRYFLDTEFLDDGDNQRLVLISIGEQVFNPILEVRHLNNDHSDNSATNLAMGTPSENSHDRPATVRHAMAVHASAARRRLNDETLAQLRRDRAEGMEYRDLAMKYGVSVGAAYYMVNK